MNTQLELKKEKIQHKTLKNIHNCIIWTQCLCFTSWWRNSWVDQRDFFCCRDLKKTKYPKAKSGVVLLKVGTFRTAELAGNSLIWEQISLKIRCCLQLHQTAKKIKVFHHEKCRAAWKWIHSCHQLNHTKFCVTLGLFQVLVSYSTAQPSLRF